MLEAETGQKEKDSVDHRNLSMLNRKARQIYADFQPYKVPSLPDALGI